MWDAPAKALVRKYFYQEFLPSQLPMQLLRSGNYLVLLSDGEEEEVLLESLGVRSDRVFSVEHDEKVFMTQARRIRQGDLKSVLYFGELTEFITHYLYTNQRFLVLNLDICGAYKTSIDPVMTPVLLFARRNPQTVIATYSNVGRDRPQLREGLKSLAVCHWMAPEATRAAVEALYGRYQAAGLKADVSFNMVLRHLFWVRSHLEHIVLGRVAMGKLSADSAGQFLLDIESCWSTAAQIIRKSPVRYGAWLKAVDACPHPSHLDAMCDLSIHDVTLATYASEGGFYHTGWFSVYHPVAAMSPVDWLANTLTALVTRPLRFSDQSGLTLGSFETTCGQIPNNQVIWDRGGLSRPCRQLDVPAVDPQLATLGESLESEVTPNKPLKTAADETSVVQTPEEVVPKKRLSDRQIASIRRLARENPDITTDQVVSRLRLRDFSRDSVTAHIAVARRKTP